jgi:hypothetical protein
MSRPGHREAFLMLLNDRKKSAADKLTEVRRQIVVYGLPEETPEERKALVQAGECTLRGSIWKFLLGVERVDAERYLNLVSRGPSYACESILSDTFRTFPQDVAFQSSVQESMLVRLLNAFVNAQENKVDCIKCVFVLL